jgi:hypothetical protein
LHSLAVADTARTGSVVDNPALQGKAGGHTHTEIRIPLPLTDRGACRTEDQGKARRLAAKVSLSGRVDAFGDEATEHIGIKDKKRLETRVRALEHQEVTFGL